MMIHFDFKVDQIDALNIMNAIHWQAIRSLEKSCDMSKTEGEREYHRIDYEYQLKLKRNMKHARVPKKKDSHDYKN